jgi:hypothetical protein
MTYELTAICDGCGTRLRFLRVEALGMSLSDRPLPYGWTHVHRGGVPGTVTPEIGIACSRACLSTARRTRSAHLAEGGARRHSVVYIAKNRRTDR